MALQTTGAISLNEVQIEAGIASGTSTSLNDDDVRGVINDYVNPISLGDARGKSRFWKSDIPSVGTGTALSGPRHLANNRDQTNRVNYYGYGYANNTTGRPALHRINKYGIFQWIREFYGTDYGNLGRVFCDRSDNAYICGTLFYTATPGIGNAFVAKYNSSGTLQWRKNWGNTNDTTNLGGDQDESTSVFVCGYNYTTGRAYLVKYDSSGTFLWAYTFGDVWFDDAKADTLGSVYAVGYISEASQIASIIKYNNSGTLQWVRRLSGPLEYYCAACSYEAGVDYVYVIGEVSDGVNPSSILLAKYNSSGTLQWQRNISVSSRSSRGYSLVVNDNGAIYIGAEIVNASNSTAYAGVFKFNTSGTLQWARQISSTSTLFTVGGMAIGGSNNQLYLALEDSYQGTNPPDDNISAHMMTIPENGSRTGTYGVLSYATLSPTVTTSSYTSSTTSPSSITSSTQLAKTLTVSSTAVTVPTQTKVYL